MKKLYLFTFVLLVGSVVRAQDNKWTLEECIEYALENNISIKQSQLDLELAEVDKADAIGSFIPSFNASATNSWNTGLTQNVTTGILQTQTTRNFSAGISAGLTLFDGLRNFKQLQRAKLAGLAAEYSLEKMKDDIALFVANSYLQVLFNKENLKVIQGQREITIQQLERTEALVEAGELPQGDLLEIRANAANQEQQIIVAENAIRISLIALAQTLLVEDYENFDIEDRDYSIYGTDILDYSAAEIINQAKEERYEIKIAEQNLEIAETDVEIAKGAYMPTLNAFFNYNTRESGMGRFLSGGLDPNEPYRTIGFVESTMEPVVSPNMLTELGSPLPFFEQLELNDGMSYGVQLSIPILNGFGVRNSVKRNKINVKRTEYLLDQAELDLESNIYQAFVDAQGALKAYESALVALEAQQLAFDYATERFEVGLINSFDLSQSQLTLENSQSEVLRTKYDYIFKLKVLELYFGVPITDLKF